MPPCSFPCSRISAPWSWPAVPHCRPNPAGGLAERLLLRVARCIWVQAALKALMDSLSFVTDSIKSVRTGVQALRSKKALLEAATTYRHLMRRA